MPTNLTTWNAIAHYQFSPKSNMCRSILTNMTCRNQTCWDRFAHCLCPFRRHLKLDRFIKQKVALDHLHARYPSFKTTGPCGQTALGVHCRGPSWWSPVHAYPSVSHAAQCDVRQSPQYYILRSVLTPCATEHGIHPQVPHLADYMYTLKFKYLHFWYSLATGPFSVNGWGWWPSINWKPLFFWDFGQHVGSLPDLKADTGLLDAVSFERPERMQGSLLWWATITSFCQNWQKVITENSWYFQSGSQSMFFFSPVLFTSFF